MKQPKVKLSEGEIGRVTVVKDFLPPPDRLALLTDAQVAEARCCRADGLIEELARQIETQTKAIPAASSRVVPAKSK
jgi:hypothetical protein